jgi:hypothetical protein
MFLALHMTVDIFEVDIRTKPQIPTKTDSFNRLQLFDGSDRECSVAVGPPAPTMEECKAPMPTTPMPPSK